MRAIQRMCRGDSECEGYRENNPHPVRIAADKSSDFTAGSALVALRKEVTVTAIETPERSGIVQNAAKLVPLLKSHALWSEQNRQLHKETVEALADAGVFRMRAPARSSTCSAR